MKRPRALLVAASVLALLRADARSDTPAGLLATVEQFDHLTLGNAVLVGSMTVRTGHFECRISGGHAAPVLAGDATVGFFFEGRGEMQYVSADSVEAPVVIFNAKKASSLKPEKTDQGVRLTDKFTRLLWIAQGEPLPALTGTASTPLTASFTAQREMFRRIRGAPLSYAFAVQRLDAQTRPLVRVEMDGGAEFSITRSFSARFRFPSSTSSRSTTSAGGRRPRGRCSSPRRPSIRSWRRTATNRSSRAA